MIRIAICDDSKENLHELSGYISGYFEKKEDYVCEICSFDSARELIKAIEDEWFDIYFLDVLIPEINGMEIGKLIRKMDQKAVIVYITVSREFAFEAFGVGAFQYLEKPVDKAELSDTLNRILCLIGKNHNCKICIRTKEGLVNISLEDIMYVENISRCSVYMLKNGEAVASLCNRGSFEKSVSFLAEQPAFVQPHKSYFVNMNFIRTFGQKSLSLENGTQIAISRKRFTETKKKYLDYMANGGMIF